MLWDAFHTAPQLWSVHPTRSYTKFSLAVGFIWGRTLLPHMKVVSSLSLSTHFSWLF